MRSRDFPATPAWVNRLSKLMEPMMKVLLRRLWTEEKGQDIAEYAVMLAVILVV